MEGRLKKTIGFKELIERNDYESCKALMDSELLDHTNVLKYCIDCKSIKLLKLFLSYGRVDANEMIFNTKNYNEDTALAYSIAKKAFELSKVLFAHPRVDINCLSALVEAFLSESFEIVKMFLECPDLTLKPKQINFGNFSKSTELIELELKYGWQYYASCAFEKLAQNNRLDVLKLLFRYGVRVPEITTSCSKEFQEVLDNRRLYLPKWNRFTTAQYYPNDFKKLALAWLWATQRLLPKDLCYLMVEYIADEWKRGWSREDVIKRQALIIERLETQIRRA